MRKPKINIRLKKQLEELNEYTGESMKVINTELKKVLKGIIGNTDIFEFGEITDERDLLEVNMEAYSFLYCLANNMSYTKKEHYKPLAFNPPKLFDYMITYKLENYGEQIFNELGFSIVEQMENGDFKIRELTQEEKEIQNKLN